MGDARGTAQAGARGQGLPGPEGKGAARHQKGVALFRKRHARGSGHRRSDATPRVFTVFTEFFWVAVTNSAISRSV